MLIFRTIWIKNIFLKIFGAVMIIKLYDACYAKTITAGQHFKRFQKLHSTITHPVLSDTSAV